MPACATPCNSLSSVTRYAYDQAGRKLSVSHPSAGLTTFLYDHAGNVLKKST
ncbi:MAG: hypothetical protein J6Y37_00135, partial [Paludibacteraceae bacterium]|nr:hypothetical protein [Paludibacteraceae bacterium]